MRDDDFRDFVRARSPALSRTAYLLTGDHHLAQDLLQSALAKTYQHWPRVRDGNPEAYVRRALHNTYVSWWRRQPPTPPMAEVSPATTDGTEAALRRITILQALRALTPRQRAVIVLRYFEDLKRVTPGPDERLARVSGQPPEDRRSGHRRVGRRSATAVPRRARPNPPVQRRAQWLVDHASDRRRTAARAVPGRRRELSHSVVPFVAEQQ
ncbi:MAG: SigE family RNA polymerase sigma factor [Micromonosporaceae bacterium]|nr:SigE family RNA polymerase sigma factor [Micromonosporaceae bacterium]